MASGITWLQSLLDQFAGSSGFVPAAGRRLDWPPSPCLRQAMAAPGSLEVVVAAARAALPVRRPCEAMAAPGPLKVVAAAACAVAARSWLPARSRPWPLRRQLRDSHTGGRKGILSFQPFLDLVLKFYLNAKWVQVSSDSILRFTNLCSLVLRFTVFLQ
ncbi:uncharacterized protein LOC123394964 [Hordeum vulgare subsp. vulgare]|uniref:uncharacterized protein LOC123394964 n=1 Tax=Hordeum vulgare subsp. vulgare TaxID=112509 RepID=UPI001D1A477C|nr:uncharacterized protein LOC123394964 [Hordeum vulgare subsp. vulgare]